MKRALIATILGMAASVATSYGQGHVLFSTYVGTVYSPVRYINSAAQGHPDGEIVGAGFSAFLYYGLGSGLSFNALTRAPGSLTPINTTSAPGYITGGAVTLPNYVSGPVTFAIVCFNGSDWNNGSGTFQTNPLQPIPTWTEPLVQSTANPVEPFTQNVPLVQVSPVPEPTTLALAGLGSAALLIFRRRK